MLIWTVVHLPLPYLVFGSPLFSIFVISTSALFYLFYDLIAYSDPHPSHLSANNFVYFLVFSLAVSLLLFYQKGSSSVECIEANGKIPTSSKENQVSGRNVKPCA